MRKKLITFLTCATLLLLCSCTTYRTKMIKEWEQNSHLVELDKTNLSGRYANQPMGTPMDERWFLWTLLTERPSSTSDVVKLQVEEPNRVVATLESGARPADEQTFLVNTHPRNMALGTQYHIRGRAFPLFWGLGQDKLWLGTAPDGRLDVYFVPGVSVMIGPVPIVGDGGGPGGVVEFRSLKQEKVPTTGGR